MMIQNCIYRFVADTCTRIRIRIRERLMLRRYRGHACDQSFNWNWAQTHFNRIALVNLLALQKPGCAYLEIGCAANHLFDSIPIPDKTGVDPQMGGTVRTTSDAFFQANDKKFDVIFIDALHEYAQVHRDAVNAIRCLKPGGWIAFHDMLPANWIEQHVPSLRGGDWTGDVWKLAFELAQSDGIDFRILRIDYGVGVMRLTGKDATVKDLSAELASKQFDYLHANINKLPIIGWEEAQDWLRNA